MWDEEGQPPLPVTGCGRGRVPYPLPSPLLGWDEGGTLPPQAPGWVGGGEVAYHLPSHSWVGMKEVHSLPRPLVGWGEGRWPNTYPATLGLG